VKESPAIAGATMKQDFQMIEGIKCYAPDAALGGSDYDPAFFKVLFELESANFWFRSRNRIILNLFSRFLGPGPATVLEVGCGTGFVLQGLSEFPRYRLFGAELHLEGLRFARQRLPNVEFLQLDIRRTPFDGEFDAVGAFDVLEHIDEDLEVMRNVHRTLKKGGLFFLSVPQHPWLWSAQDAASGHKRRYTRSELTRKLREGGFKIEFASSFVFALFPVMAVSRLLKGAGASSSSGEFDYGELKLPPLISRLLEIPMRLDESLIKLGASLPFGGSLVVVARKT
jgi:SAM-dependent methyltransferase